MTPPAALGRASDWVRDRSRRRRLGGMLAFGLAIAAPLCAILTYLLMTGAGPFERGSIALPIMLVIDFVLAIALLGLIAWRLATIILARRARSAGSRLHLRMVRLFTVVAVAPALVLGLFAAVTVTFGLEGWLNARVGGVVRNSVSIAEAYLRERNQAVRFDATAIMSELVRAAPFGVIEQRAMSQALARGAAAQRIGEVYVIDSAGKIIARGPDAFLFLYEAPSEAEFSLTREGEILVFQDRDGDAIRALAPLPGLFDAYLYLTRPVDGAALRARAETRALATEYEQLEARRGDLQIVFALLYLGFATLILLATMWFGIWISDRLARPIGRLATAADRVAKGDLSARVIEEKDTDEIGTLSRVFNRMTEQVERQRDALIDANRVIDQRRQFTEAVLSGVSAGVLGLDAAGRIELANGSSAGLLSREYGQLNGVRLADIVPGIAEIIDRATIDPSAATEGRAVFGDENGEREFLVRVAAQGSEGRISGYVVTLDDMTDLLSAQRLAAWGDVARRVAHEIRNPLTPIQLSAERLKRRFGKQVEDDRAVFEQCTDTIVRQVEQIRRMVEEFAEYARMPPAAPRRSDLAEIVRSAAALQAARDVAEVDVEGADAPVMAEFDSGLVTQALVNLLKNAGEAVAARCAEQPDPPGRIVLRVLEHGADVVIEIADNGPGLPVRERNRLTEPYVTLRSQGTGLGLSIVRRIVEDHGGVLTLGDAEPFQPDAAPGALVRIRLPREAERQTEQQNDREPSPAVAALQAGG